MIHSYWLHHGRGGALGAICLLLTACQPSPPPSGNSLFAALPEGLLTSRPALDDACGAIHQKTSSTSPRAQASYDQGLACLGTFDWVNAARSFHSALAEDPSLAVAYSGLARAYLALEEPEKALTWARQGRAIAETGTEAGIETGNETAAQAWTTLAEVQLSTVLASPAKARPLMTYRRMLEEYAASNPQDPHTLSLLGHAWNRADDWGQGGGEASTPWYRKALEADPGYFPAHHFLAHSLENQGLYEEALAHARRFAELAPKAPHAHHMVAHTAPRLGHWQEALDALETADALHRARFRIADLPPEADWHFSHNLRLLGAVALRLEKPELARRAYKETFDLLLTGNRGGYYCGPWIEFLLHEGQPKQALEAAEACLPRSSPLAGVLASSYRGEALLELNQPEAARRSLAQAEAKLQRWGKSLGPVSTEKTLAAAASRTVGILKAKLAIVAGPKEQGEKLLAALGEDLAQGKSFDAWASGRGRLQELQAWAGAHQAPALQERLAAALAALDEAGNPEQLAAKGPGLACY